MRNLCAKYGLYMTGYDKKNDIFGTLNFALELEVRRSSLQRYVKVLKFKIKRQLQWWSVPDTSYVPFTTKIPSREEDFNISKGNDQYQVIGLSQMIQHQWMNACVVFVPHSIVTEDSSLPRSYVMSLFTPGLMIGPWAHPKRVFHTVRYSVSCFNLQ